MMNFKTIFIIVFNFVSWKWFLTWIRYVCVRSVFSISAKYSSLTVTMILTLRKFLSLIFSVIYFQNPFTFYHWCGTLLVFGGTLMFSDFKSSKLKDQWCMIFINLFTYLSNKYFLYKWSSFLFCLMDAFLAISLISLC